MFFIYYIFLIILTVDFYKKRNVKNLRATEIIKIFELSSHNISKNNLNLIDENIII
jgi:hypothetical protein